MEITNISLVSVIIITYNSANYVEQTLESAKSQTYANLELIISDDGSTDNTIEVCQNWLANNSVNFKYSTIITVEKNTGIPANCNRGVKESSGFWLKIIAGDDILLPNCLETMYQYCITNEMDMAVSPVLYIDQNSEIIETDFDDLNNVKAFFRKDSDGRLESFLRHPIFLFSPTLFFSRNIFDLVDGFDERIRLLEDQPFFIKCFLQRLSFGFCPEVSVKYRKHLTSAIGNNNFSKSIYQSFLLYRKPNLKSGIKNNILICVEELGFKFSQKIKNNSILDRIISRIHYQLLKILNS